MTAFLKVESLVTVPRLSSVKSFRIAFLSISVGYEIPKSNKRKITVDKAFIVSQPLYAVPVLR